MFIRPEAESQIFEDEQIRSRRVFWNGKRLRRVGSFAAEEPTDAPHPIISLFAFEVALVQRPERVGPTYTGYLLTEGICRARSALNRDVQVGTGEPYHILHIPGSTRAGRESGALQRVFAISRLSERMLGEIVIPQQVA
jgi:hypothetical protein